MSRFRIAAVLAISSLALIAALASRSAAGVKSPRSSGGRKTLVLELFTSQGCSSCPPADRVLSKLGREQVSGVTVIPLAWHVDYWNHLGWTDPFSSASASARQGAYAQALKTGRIYTPQLVLNGNSQMTGSAEARIREEIARQLTHPETATARIESMQPMAETVKLEVHAELKAAANRPDVTVLVALFENGVSTLVARGENAGRRLPDDYIVRWSAPLGTLNKGRTVLDAHVTVPLRPEWNRANLGVAVIVQDTRTMEVYGATSLPIRLSGPDRRT